MQCLCWLPWRPLLCVVLGSCQQSTLSSAAPWTRREAIFSEFARQRWLTPLAGPRFDGRAAGQVVHALVPFCGNTAGYSVRAPGKTSIFREAVALSFDCTYNSLWPLTCCLQVL